MPLLPGKNEIGHNIEEMEKAGHPRAQAIAAALNTARRAHREEGGPLQPPPGPALRQPVPANTGINTPGGIPGVEGIAPISGFGNEPAESSGLGPEAPTKIHTGPIRSQVSGRTDHLPVHVPSGAYVIPADIVSAMGEGNTEAGFKVAKSIFAQPFYGTKRPGDADPYDPSALPYDANARPYSHEETPYSQPMPGKAAGGAHGDQGVPVVLAGGEFVVNPGEVRHVGEGNLDDGHKSLDQFVLQMRHKTVKTLKNLPGPKTS